MKFSRAASIALAIASFVPTCTNAFSPSTPVFSSRTLSKSTLNLSTASAATTDKAAETMPPDFAAVYKGIIAKLDGKIPETMQEPLIHFITEYVTACANHPETKAEDAAKIVEGIKLGMTYGMGEKMYKFGNTHKAIRSDSENNPQPGLDFYDFGVDFFKNTVDIPGSVVLGEDNAKRAFENIKKGENVVFLANHQSEADPQVFSICLEKIGLKEEAAEVIYVAGHKVTTDALAIPFSMGRNLLCIHSKKHIDAEPEMKGEKQKQNLASMSAMLGMLREGGTALWVAPSGGRDRRNVETGDVPIAQFDQKTIDMFRLMGNKSKVKTHFYPLAMVSYELCPPPDTVEIGVGERRNVRYTSIGVAIGKEVPNVGGVDSRHLFTDHAFEECQEDYEKLLKAIAEKKEEVKEEKTETPEKPPL